MASNEYVPFGTGGGANVETPAEWLADATRLTGFVSGTAPSTKYNTALRQGTEIAAMIGQFIANKSGQSALDDGNITTLLANFIAAIQATVPVYFGIDTGTTNAYVVNPSPAIPVLTPGTILIFQAASTNTTTCTMDASSTGLVTILSTSRVTLIGGAIADLGIYILVYDGTYWQLVSGTGIQTAPLGTTIDLPAGSAAINANDVVEFSGTTNSAYPATTIDYAVSNTAIVQTPYEFGLAPLNGSARIAVQRDAAGNIFILNTQSSNLWVNKFSPTGSLISSAQLDFVSSTIFQGILLKLSNGNFCAVYARASGAIWFVIFDAQLSTVAGPGSVASEYNNSNLAYHDACSLSGGGFAIVYQTSAGTAIDLITYSNAGSVVLSSTGIATYASSAATATFKIAQLPNSNLVIAMRNTMTIGGTTGTGFIIVTTGGVPVAGPTFVDTTSTLGFVSLSVLPALPNGGAFCVAALNGTDAIARVYTEAGAASSALFSSACTNNTLNYMQLSLVNDGSQFWFSYVPSVGSGSGLAVVQIPYIGSNAFQITIWGATLTTGNGWGPTASVDTAICNGMLAILSCSTGTSGQYYGALGLPDPSLDVGIAYSQVGPVALGTSAGTTGAYWPKITSFGDWVVLCAYDQQNTADLVFSIERLQTPQVVGVALTSVNAGSQGSAVTVSVEPGAFPTNPLIGAGGQPFNQGIGGAIGNTGILYRDGVVLFGIPSTPAIPTPGASLLTGIFGSGNFQVFTKTTAGWVIPAGKIRCRVVGGGQGGGTGGGSGGTTSITGLGSTFQATGGTASVGAGTGGQFQASGGAAGSAGVGDSTDGTGGGGGGAGSLAGTGGAGGTGSASALAAGGGGGCPGAGAAGLTVAGGGGGAFAANGINGGANSVGVFAPPQYLAGSSTLFPVPSNGVPAPGPYYFPFFQEGGGGGAGYGGNGAPGGGGGGNSSGAIGASSPGGYGGDGGGGGGNSYAGTCIGGNGGYGGGGGGGNATATGYKGGNGAGFAIGIFNVSIGALLTVTIGVAGTAGTGGGLGGHGVSVIEW